MNNISFRSRNFFLLLYPDNPSHVDILELIKTSYNYAYILHNKELDIKPHYHIILLFQDAKTNLSLSKELNLELNLIQKCNNIKNCYDYLLHKNQKSKIEYQISDIETNMSDYFDNLLSNNLNESEKFLAILNFISNLPFQSLRLSVVASWCAFNNYYDVFRRSAIIFIKIIDEKKLERMEKNE